MLPENNNHVKTLDMARKSFYCIDMNITTRSDRKKSRRAKASVLVRFIPRIGQSQSGKSRNTVIRGATADRLEKIFLNAIAAENDGDDGN